MGADWDYCLSNILNENRSILTRRSRLVHQIIFVIDYYCKFKSIHEVYSKQALALFAAITGPVQLAVDERFDSHNNQDMFVHF